MLHIPPDGGIEGSLSFALSNCASLSLGATAPPYSRRLRRLALSFAVLCVVVLICLIYTIASLKSVRLLFDVATQPNFLKNNTPNTPSGKSPDSIFPSDNYET